MHSHHYRERRLAAFGWMVAADAYVSMCRQPV